MRHTLLPLFVLLAACDPPAIHTDSGQLSISDPDVVDIEAAEGGPSPFLAGTLLCPSLRVTSDSLPPGDYDALDCFKQTFRGPVSAEECLVFGGPGVVDWTFTAQECPGNEFGYTPAGDHVAIQVLSASSVEGHLTMPLEDSVEALEGDEGILVVHPEGWRVEDGATWRIVQGEAFDLSPRLRTLDNGVPVAWSEGTLVSGGAANVLEQEKVGTYRVIAAPGDTSPLALEVGGVNIPIGQVEGVPRSVVKSVEIALVRVEVSESGTSLPWVARAVLRDAAGNVVLGAPVTWRFTPMVLTPGPGNGVPGADYVQFGDECTDPATTVGQQRARLTASVGLLSDSVEVVWTPRTQADPQEGWVAPEHCQTACGCASARPTHGWLAALLGLAALARRRSAV